MTQLETHMVPVATLRSAPGNARVHKKADLMVLAESLRRFGQRKAIVLDAKGRVIAGSGTLEAARMLGWTEIAVAPSELSGSDASDYALADNRTAELSQWDDEIAAARMAEGSASSWLPMKPTRGMDGPKDADVLSALRSDDDATRKSRGAPDGRVMVVATMPADFVEAFEHELTALKEQIHGLSWNVRAS